MTSCPSLFNMSLPGFPITLLRMLLLQIFSRGGRADCLFSTHSPEHPKVSIMDHLKQLSWWCTSGKPRAALTSFSPTLQWLKPNGEQAVANLRNLSWKRLTSLLTRLLSFWEVLCQSNILGRNSLCGTPPLSSSLQRERNLAWLLVERIWKQSRAQVRPRVAGYPSQLTVCFGTDPGPLFSFTTTVWYSHSLLKNAALLSTEIMK